jgi:spore coat polysaccharide biosynthesis protein SpsF
MSRRVVAIVQARQGSHRLPSKVLADIHGQPLIARVVERVRGMRSADDVVAAIPAGDAALLRVLLDLHCDTFLGSETDVLSRYVQTARLHQADVIVRVTGDCPLWDPEAGDHVVAELLGDPAVDFASNDTRVSGFPDGTDVEVFTRELLEAASVALSHGLVTDYEREHVAPWLRRRATRVATVTCPADRLTSVKMSVDTASDLERVRRLHGGDGEK